MIGSVHVDVIAIADVYAYLEGIKRDFVWLRSIRNPTIPVFLSNRNDFTEFRVMMSTAPYIFGEKIHDLKRMLYCMGH